MNKQKLLKDLKKTLEEWEELLDNSGEEWEQRDRQIGEIQGLQYAIDLIEST